MAVDRDKVGRIADSISEAIAEHSVVDEASVSEAISAVFTVLSTMLKGVRKMQDADERIHNIAQINSMLLNLMIEGGTKPN